MGWDWMEQFLFWTKANSQTGSVGLENAGPAPISPSASSQGGGGGGDGGGRGARGKEVGGVFGTPTGGMQEGEGDDGVTMRWVAKRGKWEGSMCRGQLLIYKVKDCRGGRGQVGRSTGRGVSTLRCTLNSRLANCFVPLLQFLVIPLCTGRASSPMHERTQEYKRLC